MWRRVGAQQVYRSGVKVAANTPVRGATNNINATRTPSSSSSSSRRGDLSDTARPAHPHPSNPVSPPPLAFSLLPLLLLLPFPLPLDTRVFGQAHLLFFLSAPLFGSLHPPHLVLARSGGRLRSWLLGK